MALKNWNWTDTAMISAIAASLTLAIGIRVGQNLAPVPSVPEVENTTTTVEHEYYNVPLSFTEQNTIREVCEDKGIDMALVLALIARESDFDKNLIDGDDYGLMQINKTSQKDLLSELQVTELLDVRQNTLCGVTLLSEYNEKYNDVEKVLMCYNLGETGAKEMWEQGIYSTDYSNDIILRWEYYGQGGSIILCQK